MSVRMTIGPGRAPDAVRPVLLPLAVFAGIRALCLAVLAGWAYASDRSARELLSMRWDSLWYVRVVEHGYDFTLTAPDGRVLSDMAFFPLLPWLERTVTALTSLGPADAGLLISAVASMAAAWGIFRLVEHFYGSRTALFTVALWAALPVSIVQSMAYSESLFVALSAWALYAATVRRNWPLAGLLASLAGLTRPVGLAVTAAVWVAAALAWRELAEPGASGHSAARKRILLGAALAPLGAAGYILWVGQRTGSLLGYLDVQGAWGNGFDGGLAFARFTGGLITGPTPFAGVALLVGVLLLLRLCWACVRQGQPLPWLVYGGIVVALALCSSGYFGSKPRLLMPAFPLLVPLAAALARTRAAAAWAVISAAAAIAAVYGAFWLHGSGPP
ncbi:glycosyltransferase family 39 protein [Streptomyces sp. NPDC004609]|uniref:glycosyltransferase family 39 protein n=1 Tax=Streptomyces sp. NPDC004609 TaxID=3364704 RepID=UPI0036757F0D